MDAGGWSALGTFAALLVWWWLDTRARGKARAAVAAVVDENRALVTALAVERARVDELRRELSGLRPDPWEGARG